MEKIPIECSKCGTEREHSITIKENTPSNVVITARCLACGETITLPIADAPRNSGSVGEILRRAISIGKYRRKIRKG